jgi:hypothetical protein
MILIVSSLIYSIQTWSVLEPFSNCGRICIQLGINLIKNTAHSTRKTGNRKMRGTRPETHPGQIRETEGQADSSGPGGSPLGLGIFFFFFFGVCFFFPFDPAHFAHGHRDGRWLDFFLFFFFCPKSKSDPTEPLESGQSFVSLI